MPPLRTVLLVINVGTSTLYNHCKTSINILLYLVFSLVLLKSTLKGFMIK